MSKIDSQVCPYCYIDVDINNHRSKLSVAAAFVDATDSRYGFSSKDLRKLGGSELSRIPDLMESDHEWSEKAANGIEIRPPACASGNRIILRLYWDIAPIACENFATLCTNGTTSLTPLISMSTNKVQVPKVPIGQSGKPLSYKNCPVHRIIKGFIMQSGDFVFGNGSGGESIYNGKKFKDEKGGLQLKKHDRRGILSMGNSGKNSNTSQFFITFGPAPQCDGKHVIFGEVISGWDVLDAVEAAAAVGDGGAPAVPVSITASGAYHPLYSPGAGYWFDQPDAESFSGCTPVFVSRPRVGVVAPTVAVYEKFLKCIDSGGVCASCIPFLTMNEEEGGTITGTDTATCTSANIILEEVSRQLEIFAVDIVLVAPVNAKLFQSFELPPSWKEAQERIMGCQSVGTSARSTSALLSKLGTNEVILVAKPADAIAAIYEMSWVSKMLS